MNGVPLCFVQRASMPTARKVATQCFPITVTIVFISLYSPLVTGVNELGFRNFGSTYAVAIYVLQ